jgi:hypothetical protein
LVVGVDAVELRRLVMSLVDDRCYERLFTVHQSGSYDDDYGRRILPKLGVAAHGAKQSPSRETPGIMADAEGLEGGVRRAVPPRLLVSQLAIPF